MDDEEEIGELAQMLADGPTPGGRAVLTLWEWTPHPPPRQRKTRTHTHTHKKDSKRGDSTGDSTTVRGDRVRVQAQALHTGACHWQCPRITRCAGLES